MYVTLEVRWFMDEALPEAVRDWYDRLGTDPEAYPSRTDYYLRPTDPALGLKVREGRIEAKRRDGAGWLIPLADGIAGRLERWCKWSFPLADGVATVTEDATGWIPVCKRRWMRAYGLDEQGRLQEVTGQERPPQGCELELTAVEKEGAEGWSLCLEAFGRHPGDVLQRTALHVFQPGAALQLPPETSMGYAEWLMR